MEKKANESHGRDFKMLDAFKDLFNTIFVQLAFVREKEHSEAEADVGSLCLLSWMPTAADGISVSELIFPNRGNPSFLLECFSQLFIFCSFMVGYSFVFLSKKILI